MVLMSMAHTQLLLALLIQVVQPTDLSGNLIWLGIGGASAFLLSYVFIFGLIRLSRRFHLIRKIEPGRKQDKVPRLGGVAIFLAFIVASLLFYIRDPDLYNQVHDPDLKEVVIYWLFLAASALIVMVHAYDDIKPLKPLPKLLAQTLAVLIILGPYINGRFNGVLLFGFSNPFQAALSQATLPWYKAPIVTLFITQPVITWAAIPAVFVTWFWMVGMMNAVNLTDGLDGLAGGVVAITGVFITITSFLLQQYTIALLSAIFTGAVLGFLPFNWNPAKIYMGDSGSQFLGLGLAVLSIMGGAKVALALMVLGVPIMDVAVVIINRIRRGQHPLHYDKTHLHYRLQATGLSVKQICYVFYALTAVFGILALRFEHFYKLIGIALVIVTISVMITWIDRRQQKRGKPIKLDGPDSDPYSGQQSNLLTPTDYEQEELSSKNSGESVVSNSKDLLNEGNHSALPSPSSTRTYSA
jgi:UDP-GlcNAc:undecaprenyl-phosphate GlcNAc-1-phosphate transferase